MPPCFELLVTLHIARIRWMIVGNRIDVAFRRSAHHDGIGRPEVYSATSGLEH
jgi:hypothetical protein